MRGERILEEHRVAVAKCHHGAARVIGRRLAVTSRKGGNVIDDLWWNWN